LVEAAVETGVRYFIFSWTAVPSSVPPASTSRSSSHRGGAAACDRVHSTLEWQRRFSELQAIFARALAWERKLSKRAG
jgi:hypothetical protein